MAQTRFPSAYFTVSAFSNGPTLIDLRGAVWQMPTGDDGADVDATCFPKHLRSRIESRS